MNNVYHILYKKPALLRYQMLPELEQLAVILVKSGRLRIDTKDKQNFVRFALPRYGVNMVFSYRELYDPLLLKRTKKFITGVLRYRYDKKKAVEKANIEIKNLRSNIKNSCLLALI